MAAQRIPVLQTEGNPCMATSLGIKVIHYDCEHIANPYPKGELPWQA
jgi:hypothetical protein